MSQNGIELGIRLKLDRSGLQGEAAKAGKEVLTDLEKSQLAFTQSVDKSADALRKQHREAAEANQENKMLGQTWEKMTNVAKNLAGAVGLFKFAQYAKEAALANAQYEMLAVSMEVVGRNAGYSAEQMEAAAKSMQEAGINLGPSREMTLKMVQAQLELANANKLATIAQDAAIIGHISAEQAMQRMIMAINTGGTRMLRTMGITIDATQAYLAHAKALGTDVEMLTKAQRSQALMNALTEKGTAVAGAYEKAVKTTAGQVREAGEIAEDVKTRFGAVFSETLAVAVGAWNKQLEHANGTMSKMAQQGEMKRYAEALTTALVFGMDILNTFVILWEAAVVKIASLIDGLINGMGLLKAAALAITNPREAVKAFTEWTEAEERRAAATQTSTDDILKNFGRFGRALAERRAQEKKEAEEAAKGGFVGPMPKVDPGEETAITNKRIQNAAAMAQAIAQSQLAIFKARISSEDALLNLQSTKQLISSKELAQAKATNQLRVIDAEVAAVREQIAAEQSLMKLGEGLEDRRRAIAGLEGKLIELGERRRGVLLATEDAVIKLMQAEEKEQAAALLGAAKRSGDDQTSRVEFQRTEGYMEEADALAALRTIRLTVNEAEQTHLDYLIRENTLTNGKAKDDAEAIRLGEQQAELLARRNRIETEYQQGIDTRNRIETESRAGITQNLEALRRANDAKALEIEYNDKTSGQIARMIADKSRFIAQTYDEAAAVAALNGASAQRVADLQRMAQYYRDLAAEQDRAGQLADRGEAVKSPFKDIAYDINVARDAAVAFGDAAAAAFGKAGEAAGGMVGALASYQTTMLAIDQQQKELLAAAGDDEGKRAKIIEDMAKKRSVAEVKTFGDIAKAAKGYFSEHSKGYKIMEAAEKGFRAIEMALAVQSFVMKMAQIAGITTATLASDAAKAASGVSSAGIIQAADSMLLLLKIALGIANQANGDPYSAPARMAAMAAIMAGVAAIAGVAFSFGGGGSGQRESGSVARQREQGTGTVLGDSSAQSKSVANALEIVRQNSSEELLYQSAMLKSLRGIEASMFGLAAMAARAGLTGDGLKLPSGGDGNTFSLDDAGIIIGRMIGKPDSERTQFSGQTLQQLLNSPGAYRYTDIARTHTGAFGRSYTAVNSEFDTLQDKFTAQVVAGARNIRDALAEAVGILTEGRVSTEAVRDALAAVNIDVTRISLAGLKGDEIQAAITAVFSAIGDDLGTALMGMFTDENLDVLAEFQRVGEGAFETIIRVANGVEMATAMLGRFGLEVIDWRDIVNKQGDVPTELIRGSILRTEGLRQADGSVAASGVGQIIDAFDGTAEELVALYERLLDLRVALRAVGESGDVLDQTMIRAAGGIDRFADGLKVYSQQFFTSGDRWRAAGNELVTSFSRLNVAMPNSREGFRQLVESLDLTTERGRTMYGQLIALAPAFDSVIGAVDDIKASISEMFGGTRRTIEMAGLDKQSQYNFLQNEADALLSQALSSNDPEQIRRIAERINENINEAFGMLTPEQQASMRQTWLNKLDNVNTQLSDHLSKLPDTLTKVQTALTTLEPVLTTTADKNQQAADRQLEAANIQAAAANTPVQVVARVSVSNTADQTVNE